MVLRYKWGEFGEVNPIKCVDSKLQDADITFADPTKTKVYFLSENKTKLLDTITDANFTIISPNINWTPTKTQSENLNPGNYAGEAHVQDAAGIRNAIFEFAIFVEKSKGNVPT